MHGKQDRGRRRHSAIAEQTEGDEEDELGVQRMQTERDEMKKFRGRTEERSTHAKERIG